MPSVSSQFRIVFAQRMRQLQYPTQALATYHGSSVTTTPRAGSGQGKANTRHELILWAFTAAVVDMTTVIRELITEGRPLLTDARVRHEALLFRTEVKDRRRPTVVAEG
jgi:hypothetical protein